jgi:hypothetical protein
MVCLKRYLSSQQIVKISSKSFNIYVGSNEEKIDKIKFLIKRNLNTLFRILKINKHFSIVDIKAK